MLLSQAAAKKAKTNAIYRENEEMKDLLRPLRGRSDDEAFEIFTRLRTSDDSIAVLADARTSHALPISPSSTLSMHHSDARVIEGAALQASPYTVPAHPWTSIAGHGPVSHLICSFFRWDTFLHPHVDLECFLQDMRNSDPIRERCSLHNVHSVISH